MAETGTAHAGAWVKWYIKPGSLVPRKVNKAVIRSEGTANLFKHQYINIQEILLKRQKSSFILTKIMTERLGIIRR